MRFLFIVATAAIQLCNAPAFGQSDGARLSAKLDCGALSSNPKRYKPFTAPLEVKVNGASLAAERPLMLFPGKETFEGAIDPLGRITFDGKYDGRGSWVYRLKGQLSDTTVTRLAGRLDIVSGTVGHRVCTLTFLDRPRELMAVFSR